MSGAIAEVQRHRGSNVLRTDDNVSVHFEVKALRWRQGREIAGRDRLWVDTVLNIRIQCTVDVLHAVRCVLPPRPVQQVAAALLLLCRRLFLVFQLLGLI